MILILALCIGVIAGVRIFLPLTALAWAGHFDWIIFGGVSSILAWRGFKWVLLAFSIGEPLYLLHVDAKERMLWYRMPLHMLSGAGAGAMVGSLASVTAIGAFGGLAGAVVGVFLGYFANCELVAFTGSARAAILVLDVISLLALLFIAAALS